MTLPANKSRFLSFKPNVLRSLLDIGKESYICSVEKGSFKNFLNFYRWVPLTSRKFEPPIILLST